MGRFPSVFSVLTTPENANAEDSRNFADKRSFIARKIGSSSRSQPCKGGM